VKTVIRLVKHIWR